MAQVQTCKAQPFSGEGLLAQISTLKDGQFIEVKASGILAGLRHYWTSGVPSEKDAPSEDEASDLVKSLYRKVFEINCLQAFKKEGLIEASIASDGDVPIYAYVTGLTPKGKKFILENPVAKLEFSVSLHAFHARKRVAIKLDLLLMR